MYKCQLCGCLTGPRVPETRIVVETRKASYPFRKKANVFKIGGKKVHADDPGGEGLEIVKEYRVCKACAAQSTQSQHTVP